MDGPLGALMEALRSRKPLVWNGNVLVVFEYDVPDSDLWKAQATMVLDADDFADLEALENAPRRSEVAALAVDEVLRAQGAYTRASRARLISLVDELLAAKGGGGGD